MNIWVDADACPNVIKEIIFKASMRTKISSVFVANQPVKVPNSPFIRSMQVSTGFDEADNEIVRRAESGDLAITQDLPLALELIEKGASVLTPRGESLTRDNIKARVNMRDFMESMRTSGIHTGGPKTMNQTDRAEFANAFDRWINKAMRLMKTK